MSKRVMVWGNPIEIETYQKSKTVWIAVGEYLGQRVEVKNQSEGSAVSLWRKTAEYRGN